jgi:two-component system response regulator HydG
MSPTILIVDDDQSQCELLQDALSSRGCDVAWRLRAEEGLALLRERDFDVVITDVNLNGENEPATLRRNMSGIDFCRCLSANHPATAVIVMTAFGNMSSALAAMHAGAHDFFNKPMALSDLDDGLRRVLSRRPRREHARRLPEEAPPESSELMALLGESRGMLELSDTVRRVADKDTTVLLSGESGTGKELVARALHAGGRAAHPFVAINCAAFPAALLEAELFGHVRGAFTDAKASRTGLFALAEAGTLFLDEIGEMPLEMQPKLLRVLQERQFRPVGSNGAQAMKARIIAATNRDLEAEVGARRFREDLYYRLNVVQVRIPPLRSRGDDVLLLARYFVAKYAKRLGKTVAGLSAAAEARLLAYDWPGNVRQLENCMECAVALTKGDELALEDLPQRVTRQESVHVTANTAERACTMTLAEFEWSHIQNALRMAKWNKTLTAKALGVDRRTLYRKLERHHGTS